MKVGYSLRSGGGVAQGVRGGGGEGVYIDWWWTCVLSLYSGFYALQFSPTSDSWLRKNDEFGFGLEPYDTLHFPTGLYRRPMNNNGNSLRNLSMQHYNTKVRVKD